MFSQKSPFFVFIFVLLCALCPITQADITTTTCEVTKTHANYPCSVGYAGIRANKVEGDKATPAGDFVIRRIFYRADKLNPEQIATLKSLKQRGFLVQPLTQDDGWVDDVNSSDYNKYIRLSSFTGRVPSHENLWRNDDKYDIIAVLGYNDDPVVKGKGSAIFMHIAAKLVDHNYQPTVGCIALSKPDLLALLSTLTPKTQIKVSADSSKIVMQ